MASSATVTSIGVLNVAMDAMKESTCPPCSITRGSAKGTEDEGADRSASPSAPASRYGITRDLLVQRTQLRRTDQRDLTLHLGQQVGPPLPKVPDARGQALRVQGEPHRVQRRGEQVLRHPVQHPGHPLIGRHHGVKAVDDERRIRVVPLEQPLHALPQRAHRRVVERGLREARGVTGDHQQGVAFPHRHVQMAYQPQDHLLAGAGAARLDEGDVAGRGVGPQRQLQLADPASLPPAAQQRPYPRVKRDSCHTETVTSPASSTEPR